MISVNYYDIVIQMKQIFVEFALRKLGNYIKCNMKGPPAKFLERLEEFGGLPCQPEDVIPSVSFNVYFDVPYLECSKLH